MATLASIGGRFRCHHEKPRYRERFLGFFRAYGRGENQNHPLKEVSCMRLFKFSSNQKIKEYYCEENGWKYGLKLFSKFGLISLKTPIIKEVTYSKGPTVRYLKHTVFCIGMIKDNSLFLGIAFFDFPMRALLALIICFGVGYASDSIMAGVIWSCLFYLLISFLSISDDNSLMSLLKRKLHF